MFEPACRGGSKRSLNISNPTPKWPRSPGEMVSAPARAAYTQTHALTRTLGPTHTRRAPRPPPLSPSALGASDFISCFLDFNLPGRVSPCPGRASLSRPELSGVLCPRLSGTGSTGLSPLPRRSEEPRPHHGRPRGDRADRGRRGFSREVPRAPRAARGSLGWASVSWASQPSPAASVEEVYFVPVAERRARGELAAPPPHSRFHPVSERNVVSLGVPTCEKWGPGWRSGMLESRPECTLPVALETGLRDREVSRSGFPSLFPRFSQHLHPQSLKFGLGCLLPTD